MTALVPGASTDDRGRRWFRGRYVAGTREHGGRLAPRMGVPFEQEHFPFAGPQQGQRHLSGSRVVGDHGGPWGLSRVDRIGYCILDFDSVRGGLAYQPFWMPGLIRGGTTFSRHAPTSSKTTAAGTG